MLKVSGVIYDEGGKPRRIYRGWADASQVGKNILVAGVAGFCVRVLSGIFMSDAQVNVFFSSGTDSTKLTGTLPLVANQGFNLNQEDHGHFQSSLGESLNINLVSSANVGCCFRYILTDREALA